MIKVLLLIILINPALVIAEKYKELSDTIRVYSLGEIVKESERDNQIILPSTQHNIKYNMIQRADATSLDALAPYIPSAAVKTNSRGESLLSLRGAGERQIAVFFDGALFNVPWDNRIDLTFIPTDIIGQISASPGAASILYGANSLGGALNISTYERSSEGFGGKAYVQFTHVGGQDYSFTHDARTGNWNYLVNLSYLNSPGAAKPNYPNVSYPDNDSTPSIQYSLHESNVRINSDIERLSGYGRLEYQGKNGRAGFSYSYIRGEKGVAPENYLQPKDTRFWRYPDWNRHFFTLNGEYSITKGSNNTTLDKTRLMTFKFTGWRDAFTQDISTYDDIDYNSIKETQKDNDETIGARLITSINFNEIHNFDITINPIFSNHFEDKYNRKDSLTSHLEYSQILTSIGGEYRFAYSNFSTIAAIGFDAQRVDKAEPFLKPDEVKVINDYSFLAGIRYKLNEFNSLYLNSGRKTRFPTLREQYSAALNRFVVNPDLGAETGMLNEVGWDYKTPSIRINAAMFANFYDGLITRIAASDTTPPKKYMRINLDKARIGGVEAQIVYYPFSYIDFEANVSYMYSESYNEGAWGSKLEYRPNYLGLFIVRYKNNGFTVQGEADYIGDQFGINIYSQELDKIAPSLFINMRISYKNAIYNNILEAFVRIDNILNSYRLSQLGLPEEGPTLRAGMNLIF